MNNIFKGESRTFRLLVNKVASGRNQIYTDLINITGITITIKNSNGSTVISKNLADVELNTPALGYIQFTLSSYDTNGVTLINETGDILKMYVFVSSGSGNSYIRFGSNLKEYQELFLRSIS